MKLKLTITITLLVALMFLGACAPKPTAVPTVVTEQPTEEVVATQEEVIQEEPVVLSFSNWQWTEAGKSDQWRELLVQFQSEYPNISFEEVAIPYDRYEDTLYTSWAGGEGPDLVVLNDGMIVKAIELGNLKPLDEVIDIGKDQGNFSSLMDMGKRDGKYYGFVTEGVIRGLIYNPELFLQAGLDPESPPSTVEEFMDACVKISELGTDITGYGVRNSLDQWSGMFSDFTAWVYGHGGKWADAGTPTINSSENIEALQLYKMVYDTGCVSRGVTAATYRKAFGLGKVGMLVDNSGMINIYKNDSPDLKVYTAVSPFPSIKTQAEVLFVGISNDSSNSEAAAKFIEWFMQPEVYQNWLETISSPTGGYKQSVSDDWLAENKWALPFIEAANAGSTTVAPEGLEVLTAEIKQIVTKHVEEALLLNVSPEEALTAAQQEVVDLIGRTP